MKNKLLITLFGLLANLMFAQSIERQVIGSAGSMITDGATISMSFTVGETFTTSLTNGTIIFNQGFHQGEKTICSDVSTYTSSGWVPSDPTSNTQVIIDSDYDTAIVGASIDACEVIINSGFTLTISAGDYLKVENDIVVNGSLQVAHEGSIVQVEDVAIVANNGSISVKKITPSFNDRDFTMMGSPMSNETKEGVYGTAAIVRYHLTTNFVPHPQVAIDDPNAENFADDNGNNWLPQTGTLNVGEGYLVKPYMIGETGGPYTTNYTQGTLNNGIVNFTTIYNSPGTNPSPEERQNASTNMLSNPYASAIDAYIFVDQNPIVDAVYYWEHINIPNAGYPGYNPSNYDMGDISMYNLSGGIAAANAGGGPQDSNQFIPSGQGFGIKANAAGTVIFNNAMRLITNNDNYRNSETIDRLYLSISNGTYNLNNTALIAFTENATNGYDRNYDAKRLATPISLYSINSDKELGIQGRTAFNEDHIIPLGFATQVKDTQEYVISINALEGSLITSATAYLKDNSLNTVTNLSENDYTFTSNEGNQKDRFVIVFTEEQLGNNEVGSEFIYLYPNPTKDFVTISSPLAIINKIEVFDLRGRKINSVLVNNLNRYQLDMSLFDTAVYIVEIVTENGNLSKRIIKH